MPGAHEETPFPSCPVCYGPAVPSLLIVEMMVKCRVFTDPVILFCDRQNQSIKSAALHSHIPGTSPHFRIRDHSVIQPNLINKCSSPVPQQSQMKMLLCGTEQSDKDSPAELREAGWTLLTALYTKAARSPSSRIINVPLIGRKSCSTYTGDPQTVHFPIEH